jgi:molecular chaperone IbpA
MLQSSIRRHFIGYNSLFDLLEQNPWKDLSDGFPPYNLIKISDNTYQVQIALAGWDKNDLTVQVENNELLISGEISKKSEGLEIHRGISTRNFTRRFILAENVEVQTADMVNGVLKITLVHNIPEALKPKKITINSGKQTLHS